MVGSRKLKQALDRTLSAQLVPIDHESLNSTFVGYSQKHKQQIFVKVFLQRQKLVTEKAVNVQLNQRVLESFTLATTPELFVLVMTDLAPRALTGKITNELAAEMGTQLANFHIQVRPFAGIVTADNLFAKMQGDIASMDESAIKKRLGALFAGFSKVKPQVEQDIRANSRFVLHGDVGVRNYQLVDGKLTLIDFERARLGVNYQDFVKLFYQDFALNEELIRAFMQGYAAGGNKVEVLPVTQALLILLSAVGIMKYTAKISDPEFKAVGVQMLATVECFLNESGLLGKQPAGAAARPAPQILNSIIKAD